MINSEEFEATYHYNSLLEPVVENHPKAAADVIQNPKSQ